MKSACALTFGLITISPMPPFALFLYSRKSSGFTNWSWKSQDLIEAVMVAVSIVLVSMLEHLNKTSLRQ